MTADLALRAGVGLLPVLLFLAAMRLFDSYKLVHLRVTLWVIAAGALAALASYGVALLAMGEGGLGLTTYSRYVAPVVEEALKAVILGWLIARQRIAFLVDAAICGFAVGAGFAMVENLYYLHRLPDAALGVWIVRGFGTALMHGGASALVGILALAVAERSGRSGPWVLLPGLLPAIVLHAAYNHFFVSPLLATAGIVLVLPPLVLLVFDRSEASLSQWLEGGFDADTQLLELIRTGRVSGSPVGQFLDALRSHFDGPVVADLLCYLRIRTELALRAKGLLMMRENGFDTAPDADTRERFAELAWLERAIGPTGLRAIKPLLRLSRRDLWQLYQIQD